MRRGSRCFVPSGCHFDIFNMIFSLEENTEVLVQIPRRPAIEVVSASKEKENN